MACWRTLIHISQQPWPWSLATGCPCCGPAPCHCTSLTCHEVPDLISSLGYHRLLVTWDVVALLMDTTNIYAKYSSTVLSPNIFLQFIQKELQGKLNSLIIVKDPDISDRKLVLIISYVDNVFEVHTETQY